ncbi:hypothetical protein BaRGS_00029464 [Batillaria attramentaria]|uniref:CBS domain-containing protein n=1 Tax=Batillaria attramentaria TaxID=370345 RepID=A0ABD0JX65_9CAEN
MSMDTLGLPLQHSLRSQPDPRGLHRPTPQLKGLTAIDSRSRRQRPGRRDPTIPTTPSASDTVVLTPMNGYHLGKVADLMRQEGWTVDFDNMAAVFFMQPQYFFVAQTLSGDIVGELK